MKGKQGDKWMAVNALGHNVVSGNTSPQNLVEWARGISGDDQKRLLSILTNLAQNEEQRIAHFLKRIADATQSKDEATKRLQLLRKELANIKQQTNKQEGITFPT